VEEGCYQVLSVLNTLVQFVMPALFVKLGFGGFRGLSSKEILVVAKDLSERDAEKVQKSVKSACFLHSLAPGWCLVFGVNALLDEGRDIVCQWQLGEAQNDEGVQ
jgi:hypothetical protein